MRRQITLAVITLGIFVTSALGIPYDKEQKRPKGASYRCPNDCGRHGTCRQDGCICDPGYTGAGCKVKVRLPAPHKRS